MRAFIAIDLPVAEQQAIGKAVQLLRQTDVRASWVRAENLHLTLRFLGDIDAAQVADISAGLGQLAEAERRFTLRLGDFGFFPPRGQPRVVYLSVGPQQIVGALAAKLNELLLPLGFPCERHFKAHITLARIKADKNLPQLQRAIRLPAPGGEFEVAAMSLYQSTLHAAGARYKLLRRFPFGH